MGRRSKVLARAAGAVVALAVPLGLGAAPAHAAGTASCSGTTNWTYSSRLTTGSTGGTLTATYALACGVVWADLFSYGESIDSYYSVPVSTTYSGSCALASLAGSSVGLLVGGSVAVVANAPGYDELDVMAPSSPCQETSSTGVSTAVYTWQGL